MQTCFHTMRMRSGRIASLVCFIMFLCSNQRVVAQEPWRDAIIKSLQSPPDSMDEDTNSGALRIMEWRLTQISALQQSYQAQLEEQEIKARITVDRVSQASKTVPIELRYLDNEARSAYAARLVGLILDLRLELATHEVLLEELQNAEPDETAADQKFLEMQQSQLKLEIDNAKLKVSTAETDFESAEEAFRNGTSPRADGVRKSNELAIARNELDNAMRQFELATESIKAERAKALADHRLAMAPLLARLKIANVALDEYEKTAPVFDTIESLRREREFAFSNRDGIAEALGLIRREEAELNVLKQLISNREKSSAESKVLSDRN
jgi:hypothetical protein